MKVQIRRGVFETNSSSTHSLQITKGNIEDAKADIISKFFTTQVKTYKSKIENDKMLISGLKCETGREIEDIFTIIENWEAKIQYVVTYLFSIHEDYDDDIFEYDVNELKEALKPYIINAAAEHNVTINDVTYKVTEEAYADEIYCPSGFPNISRDDLRAIDKVIDFVKTVLSDEYIITFGSVAYSSYEGRKIYIIK